MKIWKFNFVELKVGFAELMVKLIGYWLKIFTLCYFGFVNFGSPPKQQPETLEYEYLNSKTNISSPYKSTDRLILIFFRKIFTPARAAGAFTFFVTKNSKQKKCVRWVCFAKNRLHYAKSQKLAFVSLRLQTDWLFTLRFSDFLNAHQPRRQSRYTPLRFVFFKKVAEIRLRGNAWPP